MHIAMDLAMLAQREVIGRSPAVREGRRGEEGRGYDARRLLNSFDDLRNILCPLHARQLGGAQVNIRHDHAVGLESGIFEQ